MTTTAQHQHPVDGLSSVGAVGSGRSARSRVMVFLSVTMAISWSGWGLVLLLGGDPSSGPVTLGLWILGGFGPAFGAIVAARADGRGQVRDLFGRLLRWRARVGWYALVALPLVVAVAAVLLLGWPARPDASVLATIVAAVPTFVVMAVAGGGLEELGWRGYALPHLQARFGALPAAIGIGLVWAIWHLPLYAMIDTTQSDSNFGWFTLQAIALSVILTWIYNGTAGSVLLPVLFHAAVNTFYSSVLNHVQLVDYGRFEVLAALLMTGVAVVVLVARYWKGPRERSPVTMARRSPLS